MTNDKHGRPNRLQTRGDYRTPYVKAGWESARKGQPLDYALLDSAPNHHAAMAYETGRQIVLALRVAGETVPAWRAQSVTPTIQNAMQTAALVNRAHIVHGTGPIIVLPKAA